MGRPTLNSVGRHVLDLRSCDRFRLLFIDGWYDRNIFGLYVLTTESEPECNGNGRRPCPTHL